MLNTYCVTCHNTRLKTGGLDAQVAVGSGTIEFVAGQRPKRPERRRRTARQAEPVGAVTEKTVGPSPKVSVRPAGPSPSASPVSAGGASGFAPGPGRSVLPPVHPQAAASRPRP